MSLFSKKVEYPFKILHYFYFTNQISKFLIDQVTFDHHVSTVKRVNRSIKLLQTFKIGLLSVFT